MAIYPVFPSEKNVADESDKPDSLLTHYHILINLRNQHASMRIGEYLTIKADNGAILSYFTRQ